MSDTSTRQAAAILRQYLQGDVSYQVAQARVRRRGYSLDDPALAAELRRQDEAERAEAEAAAARGGQQDAKVNAYIRKEHERTKGIIMEGF
jgi:DNA-binding winged helix-turn-helix (wHTH) protein